MFLTTKASGPVTPGSHSGIFKETWSVSEAGEQLPVRFRGCNSLATPSKLFSRCF